MCCKDRIFIGTGLIGAAKALPSSAERLLSARPHSAPRFELKIWSGTALFSDRSHKMQDFFLGTASKLPRSGDLQSLPRT